MNLKIVGMVAEVILKVLLVIIYGLCFIVGVVGYASTLMSLRDGDFVSAKAIILFANLTFSLFLMMALVHVRGISGPSAKMKIAALLIPLFTLLSILQMDEITAAHPLASLAAVVVPLALQLLTFVWAVRRAPKNSQLAG